MTVNPKNNQSFTIPFEESPKIAFTTNYVPADFDPSSEARLLYMVFSDYYHQKTEENDYHESRSIRDDFNKDLFSKTYSEEEWNQDLNFILQCVKFYLSVCGEPVKLLPPMSNILQRKLRQDMTDKFKDWAEAYFCDETGRLDAFVVREDAFIDYKKYSGQNTISMQSFTRKLRAFVQLCPWIEEMNPKEYQNGGGRIIRKPENAPAGTNPKEMIYMKKRTETKPSDELKETELWAKEHGEEAF
jgi:hypothetical protein